MGLGHAVAIGVGGMIGAGVFSMMGVAGELAGGAAFISFSLAGVLALLCAYSFGRLGARFPSAGGPVEYLVRGLGDNWLSGGLNITLWLGYVLALALYARAFSGYALTLLPDPGGAWLQPAIIVGVTLTFLVLNVIGAEAVGRVELLIVAAKILILAGFITVALPLVDQSRVSPAAWPTAGQIGFTAAIVFLSYEGFGLITNAAEDLADPGTNLPRALAISVLVTLVIYALVALSVTGILSPEEIRNAGEYALAEAVRPALGATGFSIMAIGALFSTASAINATLYGGANVSFTIARYGGLPALFRRRLWQRARGGLVFTAVLVALIGTLFDLEGIAIMGSAAFLVVYGAVNASHLRLLDETGARRSAVAGGLLGCIVVLGLLLTYLAKERPPALGALAALLIVGFGTDLAWCHYSKRLMSMRGD